MESKTKAKKRRPLCPECKKTLKEHKGFIHGWGEFEGLICRNRTCELFLNVRKASSLKSEVWVGGEEEGYSADL